MIGPYKNDYLSLTINHLTSCTKLYYKNDLSFRSKFIKTKPKTKHCPHKERPTDLD